MKGLSDTAAGSCIRLLLGDEPARLPVAAALARAKSGEVLYTYTTIGSLTGAVDEGTIYVRLTPKAERARHQDTIAAELRNDYLKLGGVTASISS